MGSTWGNVLKISIFGESHGPAIGVVIDGFPAGIRPDAECIKTEMARRAPGQSKLTTARKEADTPVILSGMLEGVTTGAPIGMMIQNSDTRSGDYENLRRQPRPSHADMTGMQRYNGCSDIRGGGHFSGRLTAPLVFAGALCKEYLRQKQGVEVGSHLLRVGGVTDCPFDGKTITPALLRGLQQPGMPVLNPVAADEMRAEVERARMDCDSVGGVIECAAVGVAHGLGSPMLQSAESRIASLLYGIPAVKGVEFGDGFAMAACRGSQMNDTYRLEGKTPVPASNHNGGIMGGITDGGPILLRVVFKPTPSIAKPQQTLNVQSGKVEPLVIEGRHDPCIALRAPAVVEAAVAVALTDLYLEASGYEIG